MSRSTTQNQPSNFLDETGKTIESPAFAEFVRFLARLEVERWIASKGSAAEASTATNEVSHDFQ